MLWDLDGNSADMKMNSVMTARSGSIKFAIVCVLSLLLAAMPVGIEISLDQGLNASLVMVLAKNGSDNSGSGNNNNDDDDDDDDDDETDGRDNEGNSKKSRKRLGSSSNLHLQYTNGWNERIRNGRYRLVDPEGRTVSDRWATTKDLMRMRKAAGQ